jgi:hypothetical protein
LVKKTAVKKTAAKKTATSLREVKQIHDRVQSLELELRKLRNKMKILFHDMFKVGPPPPVRKKPTRKK